MSKKNKDDIELSPKYGANPMIPSCFWCGKPKEVITLVGRLRINPETGEKERNGDFKAEDGMVIDFEPCDTCKEQWKEGVVVAEALHKPMVKNTPPVTTDSNTGKPLYLTGRWTVLKENCDLAKRINGKKGKLTLIGKEIMDAIVPAMLEAQKRYEEQHGQE